MADNRYFILPHPNQNSDLWDIIIGDKDSQRTNNLGNKIVVKLPVGDNTDHPILNGIKEYTHDEILIEMNKSTWIDLSQIPQIN